MKKQITRLVIGAAMLLMGSTLAPAQTEKTPAFPGAEGFGRYTTGGRGGKVYTVTNLNDSGEGSLRWALSQSGKKTIVFSTSGTIHLNSELQIPDNTTVAGQTAPGDGICIADCPCVIKGNNVIVRYMRFRLGNKKIDAAASESGVYDGWDGFGAIDKNNIIIDHCSVSWSIDECLSMVGCKDITVQWCLVAQSMKKGHSKINHGYGGNWGGSGASYHHNLLAHHDSRTPRLGPRPTTQLDERMDMRNNVIYNFGGNGCYGGEGMHVNIVNNYYKPGGATKSGSYQYRIAGLGIRTTSYITQYPAYEPAWHLWGTYYVRGNYNSKFPSYIDDNLQWNKGIYEQIDPASNDNYWNDEIKAQIKLDTPIDYIPTTTHTAEKAYEKVLDYVGASLHRDSFDDLMISDTKNGEATYKGSGNSPGIINTQEDNKPSGASSDWSAWPTLNSTTAPTDTDGDGIPDAWETANGLNPNDATDGNSKSLDKAEYYTNLEVYLNSIVQDIMINENAEADDIIKEYYPSYKKEDGTVVTAINMPEIPETKNVEYEISQSTHISDATTTYKFENDITMTNSNNKTYATGKENGIKYSINTKYTIQLPADVSINKVVFKGYDNYDGTDSYIAEVNGTEYASTDYVFPQKDSGGNYTVVEKTVELGTPATGTLTFTPAGKQVVWVITLVGTKSINTTGIQNAVNKGEAVKTEYYNLQGQRVTMLHRGIIIEVKTLSDGSKVTTKRIVK